MSEYHEYKDMVDFHDYQGTYGAAIGDIYGSHYEFIYGPKVSKAEVRIHEDSKFTDDTVLTAAVADYLSRKGEGEDVSPSKVVQKWALRYPYAGYGGYFARKWLLSKDPQPYNSFGNGAAMRISALPYFAKDEEDCKRLSKEVTEITHNHPEGIKGAETIAVAIYKALHGASKKEIGMYASSIYDLNLDYQAMMDELDHGDEICQVTVPQALWCFLHSDSFEDCLRLCLHIRWDADTLAAIACPIAEAYYKEIPVEFLEEAKARLPRDIISALNAVKKP